MDYYDESLPLPSLVNMRQLMRQRAQEYALTVSDAPHPLPEQI
jgi:hypothetical protein